jgi:methylmalonyl-CoA mutase N-terminal domain/subunit
MGGMLRAIETGFVQREIHDAAYAHQQAVEAGTVGVVGVNKYVLDEPAPANVFEPDRKVEAERTAFLRDWRSARDAAACTSALAALEDAARGRDNLMPHILASVEAHATLGEISDRLRNVFGVYRPPTLF